MLHFSLERAPILLIAAVSVDFARGTAELAREQSALDAAALAASDQLGMPNQNADGAAKAQAYFQANLGAQSTARLSAVTLDAATGEVKVTSQGTITSLLMQIFGVEQMRIGANTTVTKGQGDCMNL